MEHEKQIEALIEVCVEALETFPTVEQLETENQRLREALTAITELSGEINTGNYSHDDVCYLNNAFIEAFQIAEQALKGTAE